MAMVWHGPCENDPVKQNRISTAWETGRFRPENTQSISMDVIPRPGHPRFRMCNNAPFARAYSIRRFGNKQADFRLSRSHEYFPTAGTPPFRRNFIDFYGGGIEKYRTHRHINRPQWNIRDILSYV